MSETPRETVMDTEKEDLPSQMPPLVEPKALQLRSTRLYCWNGRTFEEVSYPTTCSAARKAFCGFRP
jgi:hypothetical protein